MTDDSQLARTTPASRALPAPLAADAPDDEPDAGEFRPSWQDLFQLCLVEHDRAGIVRAHLEARVDWPAPMRRAAIRDYRRRIAMFAALMRLVDRCEKSPAIVAELKRVAAEERAAAASGDGGGSDAEAE